MRTGHINFNENIEQLLGEEVVKNMTAEQLAKKKESYENCAYSIAGVRRLFEYREELKAQGAPKSIISKITL